VNEAYLRLTAEGKSGWDDRVRFLAVASHLMREILIDYARKRNRVKRGGPSAGDLPGHGQARLASCQGVAAPPTEPGNRA